MRHLLAVLGLLMSPPLWGTEAEAQTVYVPHRGRVVAVPLAPAASVTVSAAPGDAGLLRIDGLPAGAVLAIDGRPFGPGELGPGWIALPPGPHFIEVLLPGGSGSIRFTVVTPAESDGYQVVPRP